MRIEHYPVEKLKKQILEIVGKHLDLSLYRVFFFGSRVTQRNARCSDIDIGIEGPEEIPAGVSTEIREALDKLPTLYRFDLVDFKKVNPEFKKEAFKSIEHVNWYPDFKRFQKNHCPAGRSSKSRKNRYCPGFRHKTF